MRIASSGCPYAFFAMRISWKLLCCVGLLLSIAGLTSLFWQHRTIEGLKSQLDAWKADAEASRGEIARLTIQQADLTQLQNSQAAQSELLRLRNEVSQLRREAGEKQRALSKQSNAATPASTSSATGEPPSSPVETYVANTHGVVAWQQTLVTGGWKVPSGKRALFFLEPHLEGDANQPRQVMLRTRVAELPEEVFAQLGLDSLKSDSKESSGQTILGSEQAATLLKTLEAATGVDLLSAPKIITMDGRQAQVRATSEKTLSGETYETGPSVDVTPRISADGQAVDLAVSAQLRLLSQFQIPKPAR